jgi:catechol 2,3-dioxygenase-like lactoylglutathione lyase family enzyme
MNAIVRVITLSMLVCGAMAACADELPLLGLAHVGIRVSDLEKSRRFYHDVLGYEEAFTTHKTDGSVIVAFFKVNDKQFIELFPGLTTNQAVPMTHVAFETDDIQKLHQMLEERGVKVSKINKGPRDGNLSCSISRPPGQNLKFLEFVQYLPDSLHSKAVGQALGTGRISTHLEHAGIIATNYEAARNFYIEKLGFRETWSRKTEDGRPALVHLHLPGRSGDYIELSSKTALLARRAAGTAAHFSLMVPDIKAAYQLALDRGLANDSKEPRFGKDERWQFNLFDPDGTRVECMQPRAGPKKGESARALGGSDAASPPGVPPTAPSH